MPPDIGDKKQSLRLDKWLWHARFFKSRSLSAKQVMGGHVRVNGIKIAKSSSVVRIGDTLTFVQASKVKVVRLVKLGQRRGPAVEAQTLYLDLSPPTPVSQPSPGHDRKGGRPTKKDRRDMGPFRGQPLE